MTTSTIRHLTIDCRSPYLLAHFWADVLGFVDDPENPDDPEAVIVDPDGRQPGLLLLPVPEPKTVKNRLHLDLVPDALRDAEMHRLVGLGATLVDGRRRPDGSGWAVLADPEGNEFCVERSAADRGDAEPVDTGRHRPAPHAAAERQMLEAMLDWYRAGVVAKVAAVSQTVASATPVWATSIAGLVEHLALVDESWFAVDFAGQSERWANVDWDADADWEFHAAVHEPIEEVVARYQRSCDRSRAAATGRDLDEIGADTERREFTLRFV